MGKNKKQKQNSAESAEQIKPNNKKIHKQENQKQKTSKKKSYLENKKQQIVSDERFEKASYDPKFMRPKKELTKVKIDSRFSQMLTDPKFQSLSKVDKYGRKVEQKSGVEESGINGELKQFYTFEEEETEPKRKSKKEKLESQDQESAMQGSFSDEDYQDLQNSQRQGQHDSRVNLQSDDPQQRENIRKWMENYNEESSSLEEMPIDEMVDEYNNEGVQVWSEDDENLIKDASVKATNRLALCNYDWMNINSKDLMILFNSFKSAQGVIRSVKVYQSNLGKEKMQEEETFGPQGIWNENQELEEENQEDNETDNFMNSKGQRGKRKSWKQLLNKQSSNAMDSRKLRAYEKERLKYYYAVIECDSKRTADQIYKECDGNQFENSNLEFDLRFIPDDISFDPSMLKQQCNEMPVRGEVKTFINKAMGHSKVDLTWEDPELSLPANLKKKNWNKMTEEEFDKVDWGTYLDDGGDVEEEDNRKQLYDFVSDEQLDEEDKQGLLDELQQENLPEWKKECNKRLKNKSKGSEELVISFDSGFNSLGSKKKDKVKEESSFPSIKKQKKSKKEMRARAEEERQRRRDQLALMNDENPKEEHFDIDVKDERFQKVFKDPEYSIDPSHPRFDHKRSGKVFKEVVQRNKVKNLE